MNTAGWAMMIVSVTAVITAMTWCFYRILTLPSAEADAFHGPPGIDTRDTIDAD
jgi:hypothetical protein